MIGFNLKLDTVKASKTFQAIEKQAIPYVMEKLIKDLRNQVEGLTPVGRDNERPKGQAPMRASWSGISGTAVVGGFLYFENPRLHAPVIEFGLYRKEMKNPERTAIHSDGQRYSTHAMGGVLRPMLENGYDGMTIEDQAQAALGELLDQVASM